MKVTCLSTRRSHTWYKFLVLVKSSLIHSFPSPHLRQQIQIYRRSDSILEKTCLSNRMEHVPRQGKYINIIKNRGKRHDRKGKGLVDLATESPRIKLYWVSPRTATYHFCCAQSRKSWDDFTSHANAYLTRAHIKCFSRLGVNLFRRNLIGHFSDGQICKEEIIWWLNLVPRSLSDEAWGERSGTRLLQYLIRW